MKVTCAASLVVVLAIAFGHPLQSATNNTFGLLNNCVITSFTSSDCSSGALTSYNYVAGGCGSCEAFDTAHSFLLHDGCPSGTFFANSGPCSHAGGQFAIDFSGPGCHGVNTEENWVSGYPCFNFHL